MSTTLGDLINGVYLALAGWGLETGRAGFVTTTALTTSTASFTVDSTENLSAGVAEIDSELIYIQSVDDATKTVTISPDGRGYRGTTAAAHAVGARVTMSPILPRAVVTQKINETILGLYPTLRAKAFTEFPIAGSKVTYGLPAEAEGIFEVSYREAAAIGMWPRVLGYRFRANANTTDYPTGKAIDVLAPIPTGATLRVLYYSAPTALTAETDLLTASGLAATAAAVVTAGAAWRLTSYLAAARLRTPSSVPDMLDQQNPVESSNRIAAYLRAQYELELQEERRRQELSQPPTINFTG